MEKVNDCYIYIKGVFNFRTGDKFHPVKQVLRNYKKELSVKVS